MPPGASDLDHARAVMVRLLPGYSPFDVLDFGHGLLAQQLLLVEAMRTPICPVHLGVLRLELLRQPQRLQTVVRCARGLPREKAEKTNCKGKSATCPYGSIYCDTSRNYHRLWASLECCIEWTMIQRPVSQETEATPTESSWIKPHSQERLESTRECRHSDLDCRGHPWPTTRPVTSHNLLIVRGFVLLHKAGYGTCRYIDIIVYPSDVTRLRQYLRG